MDTAVGAAADVAEVSAEAASEATATLFGESASRVVVSVAANRTAELVALASAAAVPATPIGRVGGDRIRISIAGRRVIDEPVGEAERIWSTAIDRYFEPKRAIA